MTLGELIDALKLADEDKVVVHGFSDPHSYRGIYSELAFEPRRNIRIGDMLDAAESAVNKTYNGWKGGRYTMDEYTDCYLAVEGKTGEEIGPLLLKLMLEKVSR